MFFYLNGHTDLLPEVKPGLHLDDGWKYMQLNHSNLYYKGYTDEGSLEDQLVSIYYGVRPAGVWAVVEYRSDTHVLYTPEFRAYPVYTKFKVLTNLHQAECNTVPSTIKVSNLPAEKITLDEAAEQILAILQQNIANIIKHNKHKLKMIFSGGIDSLVLLAILDSMTQDYVLHANDVTPEVVEEGRKLGAEEGLRAFMNVKRAYTSELIEAISKEHWGYKMTSIDKTPTACITGFWGDEIMFRNPDQINLLAKLKGTRAVQLVKPTDYMYEYLIKSKYAELDDFDTEEAVHQEIIDALAGDFQMWHLDHHTHYSPYFDIRIFKIMRQLSVDSLLAHGLTACVQKKIIELVNPTFLKLLADQKNTALSWENYRLNKHLLPQLESKLDN